LLAYGKKVILLFIARSALEGGLPMQISVIGTGYVGLVTGACFAEFGVNVLFFFIFVKRISRLEKGDVAFYESGIIELVA